MGQATQAWKARTTRDRRLGRDGDPSPSMLNRSTIGEQHGRLRVGVPTKKTHGTSFATGRDENPPRESGNQNLRDAVMWMGGGRFVGANPYSSMRFSNRRPPNPKHGRLWVAVPTKTNSYSSVSPAFFSSGADLVASTLSAFPGSMPCGITFTFIPFCNPSTLPSTPSIVILLFSAT